MSQPTSSHAYGIGMIALLVGMSVTVVFYTSFYLPESLLKPSVSEHILFPEEEEYVILIVEGSIVEGNENYVPNSPVVTLGKTNKVVWYNEDSTAHSVTVDHRTEDPYSGEFGPISAGLILPGESYEFLFTEEHEEIAYHCEPHPWMTGSITVEKSRF